MQATTFEVGARAAEGGCVQIVPANTAEDLEVVPILKLWGSNAHGQLGLGYAGGSKPGSDPVKIEGVVGLAIGGGSIIIVKKE